MVRSPFPYACLLLSAAACSTAPLPPAAAEELLTTAEAQVTAGEFAAALTSLDALAGDACPKRLRDRRDLARARAHCGVGAAWEGFRAIETFADDHPHSDLRPAVVELVWQAGQTLATSDGGFLFFSSDATAGRTILEHLITRYPETQRLADALRILGDMAFADANYELAQQRYRDLMLNRPESEWFVYAQFRFAMSIVDSLQGPDYDLDRMEHATRELRAFLATKPENPEFVRTGSEALERLCEWRLERQLRIAAFYHRVGNTKGRIYHLRRATEDDLSGAAGYAAAVQLRDEVERQAATDLRP